MAVAFSSWAEYNRQMVVLLTIWVRYHCWCYGIDLKLVFSVTANAQKPLRLQLFEVIWQNVKKTSYKLDGQSLYVNGGGGSDLGPK